MTSSGNPHGFIVCVLDAAIFGVRYVLTPNSCCIVNDRSSHRLIRRVPSGPTFSKLYPIFNRKFLNFETNLFRIWLRKQFNREISSVKMLKGFNSCTFASGATLPFRFLEYARSI